MLCLLGQIKKKPDMRIRKLFQKEQKNRHSSGGKILHKKTCEKLERRERIIIIIIIILESFSHQR